MSLTGAGFAPFFAERPLDDGALAAACRVADLTSNGHEPNPALAVNRYWRLIAANETVQPLLAAVDASLLEPPVNVLRLSISWLCSLPEGLA
jgi:MmyB-like transcription regulator ligand binding domain